MKIAENLAKGQILSHDKLALECTLNKNEAKRGSGFMIIWAHSGRWNVSLGAGVINFLFLVGINGDLDSNETASDFFILECLDGLPLLFFAANVDEAITFAPPGPPKLSANHAGRDDIDASVGEEGEQTIIVDVEAKVGDEQHGL